MRTPPLEDAALLASPLIPIQQDSAASNLMKQVLEKVETLQMALQSVDSFLSEPFAAIQLFQDVHSVKILELENKLETLECTKAAVNTTQQFSCYRCLCAIFSTSDLQHPGSCTIPAEIG